jgi:hypothetical protein
MKRRNFIQAVLAAGTMAGSMGRLAAQAAWEDTVIVRSGSPTERFRQGIRVCGGIGRFVKKGQRVVIKPTMAYDKSPETGWNTDPELVEELIRQCYAAKAQTIDVFDHTVDPWTRCYKNSGIERIAKDLRARVLPANHEMFYAKVNPPESQQEASVKIHQALLEADVWINVASGIKQKNHYTGAMENLLGCIWNREILSERDRFLADLLSYLTPAINIIDTGKRKTPDAGLQVIALDPVTADQLFWNAQSPSEPMPEYLQMAAQKGTGTLLKNSSGVTELYL